MKPLIRSLIAMLMGLTGPQGWACVGGDSTEYRVDFEKVPQPPFHTLMTAETLLLKAELENQLVVKLTDPKTGSSRQYLDDDGNLGAHLAATYLYKSSAPKGGDGKGSIDLSANKEIVEFMKSRLKTLRETLSSIEQGRAVVPRVEVVEKMLSSSSVDRSEFIKNYNDIHTAMFKAKLTAFSKSRASSSEQWDSGRTFKELIPKEIPGYHSYRGCTDSIGAFNSKAAPAAAEPAAQATNETQTMPSFGIE